ncbi:hypothetical protein I4U23_020691 [Adineta vaga]|nr:hypothetical protein I4U23_020691 [Adineta vaga]
MSTENMQSYVNQLVWLDENIENSSNQHKRLIQLQQLDNNIQIFNDKNECINYIRKYDINKWKSYIMFIICDSLSKEVIPQIHNYSHILGIFILCYHGKPCQQLTFPKLRAICTDIQELVDYIQTYSDRKNFTIDFSLFNQQNNGKTETIAIEEKYPIRNLKEDQARFLWFYNCHKFMLELDSNDKQAKQEMISCCHRNYQHDKRALKIIDQFEEESLADNAKNAVQWYTRNSIIFRCINEAFALGNIATIYSYRYFIKLLCQQLQDLYKTYKETISTKTLRLYRGQHLKLAQILLVSKHINDLISLNGFISTTLEEDVAKKFCLGRVLEDYEPVMFIIDIDLSNEQSTAFADIRKLSNFPDEEEILLSVGSVFRIKSVDFIEEKGLYRIYLSLSSHDQLMVNEYIEQTFAKELDSTNQAVLFGKLLFDMGEYHFAIDYYQNRLDNLSDNDDYYRAIYLNNLGVCYNEIEKKDEALKQYKAASLIYKQMNDHQGLGACYHNIASYYYNLGDNESALRWTLDALQERQRYPLEKASTFDLLGCIQLAKYDAEAASHNLRHALKIRLKYLGQSNPNHPDIGMSYRNLGRLDCKLSSLIDAQNNFLRAEQIFHQNYPKSHPLVIEIRRYLEDVERQLSK